MKRLPLAAAMAALIAPALSGATDQRAPTSILERFAPAPIQAQPPVMRNGNALPPEFFSGRLPARPVERPQESFMEGRQATPPIDAYPVETQAPPDRRPATDAIQTAPFEDHVQTKKPFQIPSFDFSQWEEPPQASAEERALQQVFDDVSLQDTVESAIEIQGREAHSRNQRPSQLPTLPYDLEADGPVIKVTRFFFDNAEVNYSTRYIGEDGRRLGIFQVEKGSLRKNLMRMAGAVLWPDPDFSGIPECADWEISNDYTLMAADIADAVDLILTGLPIFADIHLPDRMIKLTLDSRKNVECNS